jgi:hypothetical protein
VRRRAWPFLVLVAGLLAAPAAQAASRPPVAELRANGESARVIPHSFTWSSPAPPDGCAQLIAGKTDFVADRPTLELAHRHARPRVVFLRDRRPKVRQLLSYVRVDAKGRPVGAARLVETDVRPRRRSGKVVAWAVQFRVDVRTRPYFRLDVTFPRRSARCHEGGRASYGFGFAPP